jgi:hypothetical protein
MPTGPLHSSERHPWAELSPELVLESLVYELYGPISSLGGEVDRLNSGTFEDEEELSEMIENMREHINALSRVVVALKRYNQEHPPAAPES